MEQQIIIRYPDGFIHYDRPEKLNSSTWTFIHTHNDIVKVKTLREMIKIKRSPTTQNLLLMK
jgi:hypothetical protein